MAIVERTIIASVPSVPINIGGTTTVSNAETFDGTIPGPTILLNVGDTFIVRLINKLPHATGIHWHGIELENYADGTEVTQSEVPGGILQTLGNGVPAGGTFLYKFKVPRAGVFWYHPHHHHSTNRVFRGQYGMIVVTDPAVDPLLVATNTFPDLANTHQLVLSDITVCKVMNDTTTYVDPNSIFPPTDRPEWLSSPITVQNGITPDSLCVVDPLDEHGMGGGPAFAPGEIPNTFKMMMVPGTPTVEGQIVLTNGVNAGGRFGTPALPQALLPGVVPSINVQPGQGIRFQIANTATTRYFRLTLRTPSGTQIDLIRVGGEGGILNAAVIEGGTIGTLNTKYNFGEILLGAGSRADVVAIIPAGISGVCTMWTRDFQRVGGVNPGGWSQLPTVPVLHISVSGADVTSPVIANNTPLKSALGIPTLSLGAAPDTLLNPGTFSPEKIGWMTSPENNIIRLSAGGGANGIDGVEGSFDLMPYTNNPHIPSTRYAKKNDILQLTVENTTGAHHPFHLHGFSFQPVSLGPNGAAATYTWPYVEFRDNLDIPAGHTLTFKVHISDRELADGITMGGALGRWLFHCHIFFHAHHGMISELVITDQDGTGSEKPNVNVGGSWAYINSGGIATRQGTFSHPDGDAVSLSASIGTVNPLPAGRWEWSLDTAGPPATPDGFYYVYITATDPGPANRKDQAVFRLQVGGMDEGSDNGDPHIHTVDGKRYDFQAAGEFTLLKDTEGLEVQTRQTPVLTANPITDDYSGLKSCVSLNTAVAARVGTHRISYQPGRERGQFQFFLDGKPSKLPAQGLNLDGNLVSNFDVGGVTSVRVDYLHHAVLIITPLLWTSHNVWYLNISISRTQADEGLMGIIPQNSWLPLLPTGASVGSMPASLNERYNILYKTFADAWRLTDKSSLFVYQPGTSTSTFTDKDWPAGAPPCNLKPQFEIPGWIIPEGMDIEKAKQVCQIITDDGLNRDCVFDVATTGDEAFAKGYLITQEIRQRATAVQIVSTQKDVVTAIVSTLIGKQPKPKGKVVFYVDDKEAGQPIVLNESGRAQWRIAGFGPGTYDVRAAYYPADINVSHQSISPAIKISVSDNSKGTGEETNKGCIPTIILLVVTILKKLSSPPFRKPISPPDQHKLQGQP